MVKISKKSNNFKNSENSEKANRVRARVISQTLASIVKQSQNILIMGHKQSDLDSFGASLAVAKFAKAFEKDAYVIVDENSLEEQLKISHCEDRRSMPYHQMILNKVLPYTIGGGIGQSRICMFFLDKLHIGEVQASIWSQEVHEICRQMNIKLL